jgi:hypothetical protein
MNLLDKNYWKVEQNSDEKFRSYYEINDQGKLLLTEEDSYRGKNQLRFYHHLKECFSRYQYSYTKNVLIEPDMGWLINEKKQTIFGRSFPYAFDPYSGGISFPKTFKYINPLKKLKQVEEAISIRYFWRNYHHFFFDALPQLFLANRLNIPKHIPVIIPISASKLHYVQSFILLNEQLNERPIIWQKSDEYIRVKKKTYLLKEFQFSIEAIEHTLNSFYDVSFRKNKGVRKIFLTRSAAHLRSIKNSSDVENFMAQKGFEIICSDEMSLEEQMHIFSSTSEVVAVHGAGLTNIIFRIGRPLKIVEIMPEGYEPKHYEMLSIQFGFKYEKITGLPLDSKAQFLLPLERLKTSIYL